MRKDDRYRAMTLLRLAVFCLVVSTGAAAAAQERSIAEFDLAGLSCDGCAATAADVLRKLPGVRVANVLFTTGRARVESERKIAQAEFRTALASLGFEARFAGELVPPPLTGEERASLDIRVASRGEAFEMRKHLAPGKFTIFDFWAAWCGPCRVLTPKIERLVQQNPRVALRTIDLKDWDSAAGRQATREFKVPALPYVRVYGPDGRFVGEVVGNDIGKIRRLVGAE